MLGQFLVIGSLFFWILLAGTCCLVLAAVEGENAVGALFTIVGFIAIVVFFSNFDYHSVREWNPWHILGYIALYILLGIGWGYVKWIFFLLNARDDYRRDREIWKKNFERDKKDGSTTYDSFETYLNRHCISSYGGSSFPPSASENKERITTWMAYWPFSALWTLSREPLKRLYNYLHKVIAKSFEQISRSIFASEFEEFDNRRSEVKK